MCVYNRMFNDFVYGNYTRLNTILSLLKKIVISLSIIYIYLNAVDMVFYRFQGLKLFLHVDIETKTNTPLHILRF